MENKLRDELTHVCEDKGIEAAQARARELGIRRLRYIQRLAVVPLRDQDGDCYKAYKGDSNWGVEIYVSPSADGAAGRWAGKVISRFHANQREFKPGQTFRPHPAAKLVMRLQINDCVEMLAEKHGTTRKLYRLQKMARNGSMNFAELHEANVDHRNRRSEDQFKYLQASPTALQARGAVKVHVSATGRVNRERRAGGVGE